MSGAVAIIWLLAILYTLVSLITPLPPYKSRLRALFMGIPVVFVIGFVASIVVFIVEDPKTTTSQKQSVPKVPEETISTTPAKPPEPEAWRTAGFPDEARFEHARIIGLESYDAYKLLEDQSAIRSFCDWDERSWAITLEAEKRFGTNVSGDKFAQKSTWERKHQDALNEEKQTELGISFEEGIVLSTRGHWHIHCEAKKLTLKIATPDDANRATDDDVKEIEEALILHYIYRLHKRPNGYFKDWLYSVASCRQEKVADLNVVGCRLKDYGRSTDFDYFVAARLEDGRLVAAAIARMPHLTDIETRKITTAEHKNVYLRRMAADRFNPLIKRLDLSDFDEAFGVKRD